jgi:hypothetical protein
MEMVEGDLVFAHYLCIFESFVRFSKIFEYIKTFSKLFFLLSQCEIRPPKKN